MMKTFKDTIHTIGDRGGDFAKTIGSETADLAKRFGHETTSLAKRIGPRRGLIGLAVLAGVIGGSVVLVRYLRARKLEKRAGADANEGRREDHGAKSSNRSPAQPSGNVYPSH